MTARTRLWVLVVSTPVIAFTLIGGYLGQAMTRDETLRSLRVFEDVMQLVVENYVENVDVQKAMRGAMRGLTDGLDVDSAFLNPDLVKAFESKDTPAAGELGIDLTRGYYLRVVSVRDGSPAAKAGIRTGDYLRAIDGRSTRDISAFEGNRLLRGGAGSKVTLLVIRGSVSDPHEVAVNRERLSGAEVSSRMANASTGYIRVVEFTPNSAARIKQAVDALAKTGAARYVIDVRGTSRGDLDSGIEAARLFVRGATLAVRVSRDPLARPDAKDKTRKDSIAAQANDGTVAAPVVLLVDSGTSGAAELFAAALDGNNRAELVGERTIGRVARQQLVKLPDGSGLLLTSVRYLSPSSAAIHEKGLTPDVHVPEPDVDFGADPPKVDAALDKAIERLAAPAKQAA
ncbi:MAG TPA: S41 family peptidase [Vicinamibacterales bacterium]|jgi:carboxyl-terminal processing protease|nr:S41 family peptidase [Vicinamibacterales bacterium]